MINVPAFARRLYYKLTFFLFCRLWPRLTKKPMWKFEKTKIIIADPEREITLEIGG